LQRTFARRPGGAVLDGRDIGTVICPEAEVKIFVTASPETRASRRALELKGQGETVDYAEILEDIRRRDARDANRAAAPLKAADDAMLLDTTKLDIEAVFQAARAIVKKSSILPSQRRLAVRRRSCRNADGRRQAGAPPTPT
jgi:cytidylate kinase